MSKNLIVTDEAKALVKPLDLEAGRRSFIKSLGLGAVGAAVFGAAAGKANAATCGALNDYDILNFALNLEYLEATFYHYAYYGTDIPAGDTTGAGTPGQVMGGAKVPFKDTLVQAYALEIATEEVKHVEFLRAALGSKKVARPTLNIGTAFAAAASAAGLGEGFNAYASDLTFLLASYIFEDVGVTAYHGAAGLIQDKGILNAAAGILAVEAYHAGIIRTSLFAMQTAFNIDATSKISALRSKLANNGKIKVDDIGIGSLKAPTLVPVDAPFATMFKDLKGGDAIAYARTPSQVLNIVYGNTTATPGLFFPNGIAATGTNLPGGCTAAQ